VRSETHQRTVSVVVRKPVSSSTYAGSDHSPHEKNSLLGPDLPPQQRQATQALDIPITPPTSGSPAMNLSRSASPRPQQTSPISAYPSSQQPTSQGMAATAAAAAAAVAAKQPNVEIYGFVIYLGSFIGYGLFACIGCVLFSPYSALLSV